MNLLVNLLGASAMLLGGVTADALRGALRQNRASRRRAALVLEAKGRMLWPTRFRA